MKSNAVVLALVALTLGRGVGAQEASEPTLVSLSGGFGVGTLGIGGGASLSASHSSGDYILRMSGTSEVPVLQTPESIEDLALLYGRRVRWSRGWARAALGVAHVRRVERGEVEKCEFFACRYEELTSTAVGLAGHFDLVWAPSDVFGLGLTGLVNRNGRQSFGALALAVHLGGVR